MTTKIGFIIFFSGVCAFNAFADSGRDLLIQKELDCIDQHKNNGLTWDNVCSMPEPSNAQLDQAQGAVSLPNAPQEFLPQETTLTNFNDRVNTFSISPHVFYSHYSEPQKTRTISGVWDGLEGKYIFRPSPDNILNNPVVNYFAIEGLYAQGRNSYRENEYRFSDGSITKLTLKDIPGYMFENRALFGRDFTPMASLRLTPYTGFGVRYKTDQSAGHYNQYDYDPPSPVVALGWNFSDLYYYIPTGLTLDLAANKDYEVSLNVEYDYLVKGYERDDYASWDQFTIPQGVYPNSNSRYSLDHGWGGRSSLKFLKHFSLVDIYFEPYVRYWHINASKVASGTLAGQDNTTTANKNTTLEVGSSLGVQF